MSQITVYHYEKCDSCRKAIKYLRSKDIQFQAVSIVEQPPSKAELEKALKDHQGNLKKLFNTSGRVYREMGLGEKLKSMTEAEAMELLSQNGMLVKRPFVAGADKTLLGFKQDQWEELL